MGRPNILYTAFVAQDFFSPVVGRMGASVKGLTAATGVAGARMSSVFSNVGMALGASVIIPLGLATKAAIDFQEQMTNVSTLVDTSVENMDAMGDSLLRMSRRIPKPVSDLTEALYQIRSGGIDAAHAMNVLDESAKLGVAGLGSATNAANVIVAAINTFKRENLSAAQAADILFKTVEYGKTKIDALSGGFGQAAEAAELAHVKLSELQAMTATITNLGVPVEQAQTQIEGAMRGLIKPTSEMREILTNLTGNAEITGSAFIEMSGGIVEAFKKIIPEAERLHMDLPKVIGRGTGFYSIGMVAGEANDAFNKLNATMAGANTINAAYAKQTETAASQLRIFQNTTRALGISLGNILLPVLVRTVTALTPIIDLVAGLAKNHKTLTEAIIITALAFKGAKLAAIGYNFVLGIMAVTTTSVTQKERLFNLQLAATPGYARGAAAGLTVMNTSAKSLLLTLGRIAIVAAPIYALMKAMDEHDKKRAKMDVVLAHLPEGVDREKMKNTPLNYYMEAGGLTADSTTKSYMKIYEDIGKQYYDDPMKIQDSVIESMSNPHALDTNLIKNAQQDNSAKPLTTGKPTSATQSGRNTNNIINAVNSDAQTAGYSGSAQYSGAGANTKHTVEVLVSTAPGLVANTNMKTEGGPNKAGAVPMKLVSTTSKRPKQPIA